jgi:hypothetical protein
VTRKPPLPNVGSNWPAEVYRATSPLMTAFGGQKLPATTIPYPPPAAGCTATAL